MRSTLRNDAGRGRGRNGSRNGESGSGGSTLSHSQYTSATSVNSSRDPRRNGSLSPIFIAVGPGNGTSYGNRRQRDVSASFRNRPANRRSDRDRKGKLNESNLWKDFKRPFSEIKHARQSESDDSTETGRLRVYAEAGVHAFAAGTAVVATAPVWVPLGLGAVGVLAGIDLHNKVARTATETRDTFAREAGAGYAAYRHSVESGREEEIRASGGSPRKDVRVQLKRERKDAQVGGLVRDVGAATGVLAADLTGFVSGLVKGLMGTEFEAGRDEYGRSPYDEYGRTGYRPQFDVDGSSTRYSSRSSFPSERSVSRGSSVSRESTTSSMRARVATDSERRGPRRNVERRRRV